MIDIRNYALIGAGVALAAALAWGGVERVRGASARQALAEYKLAVEQESERQREANRGRATVAETKQATQTVYRDRFITQTISEVIHATQPLAACPVPADAIRLLNDAASCVSEDRPATCGAGDGVRPPG